MARPLRIELPGAYYHIMNRGLARQVVFVDRIDRTVFLKLLGDCHEMWGIRVLAYCLLDTHYHVLLETPEANLSRIMRHLGGVYTQRFNRRHGRDGPLFRGRYTAILVDGETYLLAVARYIHQNPVAAGLVRSPETYEWSSCRLYLAEGTGQVWLDTGQVLSRFPRKEQRTAFLDYMKGGLEEPVRAFYANQRRSLVLGTRQFVDRVRKSLRKRPVRSTGVGDARAYVHADADTCIQIVGQVFRIGQEDLLRSRRGQRNEARAVAMYACRHLAGMKLEAIARRFRVRGYSTVSSVIGRAARELGKGGVIARRFEQIRRRLQT